MAIPGATVSCCKGEQDIIIIFADSNHKSNDNNKRKSKIRKSRPQK